MLGRPLLQQLNSAQPGKWDGVGVKYNNGFAGIYCVGLPGGVNCVQQITQLNARCPQTKFIVGGFSQGAMVAHNCAAFAPDKVKKKIAVSNLKTSLLILPGSSVVDIYTFTGSGRCRRSF
jgi:pimeloyl-ACP methyl ester carboxylesterase